MMGEPVRLPSLMHQAVEVHAQIRPNKIAIEVGPWKMSYRELAAAMDRLAGVLQSHGVSRGDRVVIFADNGIEACVALLGILRVDACFVPLNPSYPAQRVAEIVNDADAVAIVATGDFLDILEEAALALDAARDVRLFVLDRAQTELDNRTALARGFATIIGRDDIDRSQTDPSPNRNGEDDLAYIIFTSGTTGRPKGVMVQHRAIRSTITWGIDYFHITHDDRLSNHSRLSFDVALFDIFCAFFTGATLCPVTERSDLMLPFDFIQRMGITFWFSVPSVLAMLDRSRQLAGGPFKSLRAALFAGEALAPQLVSAWRRHQGHVPIYNLYGPTEAAIVVTVHNVGVDSPFNEGEPVPIGVETRDSEIVILDLDRDRPAAPGKIGRLMICGAQLAAGYWRRPELTATAFPINPLRPESGARMYDTGDLAVRDERGIITFQGRRDSQVKVKGYRIELGEIESVMGAHTALNECVAMVDPKSPDTLVSIVSATGPGLDAEALFAIMERRLPAYMVPSRVIILDDLPHNQNGKIDRNALAEMLANGDL